MTTVEDREDGVQETSKTIVSECDVTFELYRILTMYIGSAMQIMAHMYVILKYGANVMLLMYVAMYTCCLILTLAFVDEAKTSLKGIIII